MERSIIHEFGWVTPIQLADRCGRLLAADHLKKHPLKMMSTLTIALNHSKEEEEE